MTGQLFALTHAHVSETMASYISWFTGQLAERLVGDQSVGGLVGRLTSQMADWSEC